MTKQITVKQKEVVKTGETNGRTWKKYKYTSEEGETFYMFDDLTEGQTYKLMSKEREYNGVKYTDWKLYRANASDEKLDEILKLLKWLVKNNPNYPQKSMVPGERQIEY